MIQQCVCKFIMLPNGSMISCFYTTIQTTLLWFSCVFTSHECRLLLYYVQLYSSSLKVLLRALARSYAHTPPQASFTQHKRNDPLWPPPYVSYFVHHNTQVAVLQPFLKRVSRRRLPVPDQDQLRATATLGEATSKLEEAVALVDTLGCEVVFKEVCKKEDAHSDRRTDCCDCCLTHSQLSAFQK